MKVGYARVSTEDQRLDLQLTALKNTGCNRIFKDHGISGAEMSRPRLEKMLRTMRPGQTLMVWRLDRLGRSLTGLVQLVDELGRRDIGFQSITEELNTTTSGGRLIFHIMATLAEFERTLISERTKAGMLEAQSKGRRVGRPPSLTDQECSRPCSTWKADRWRSSPTATAFPRAPFSDKCRNSAKITPWRSLEQCRIRRHCRNRPSSHAATALAGPVAIRHAACQAWRIVTCGMRLRGYRPSPCKPPRITRAISARWCGAGQ